MGAFSSLDNDWDYLVGNSRNIPRGFNVKCKRTHARRPIVKGTGFSCAAIRKFELVSRFLSICKLSNAERGYLRTRPWPQRAHSCPVLDSIVQDFLRIPSDITDIRWELRYGIDDHDIATDWCKSERWIDKIPIVQFVFQARGYFPSSGGERGKGYA